MRKHRADYVIMVLVMLLLMVGLIVVYAIGPSRANFLNSAYGGSYGESYFFLRQLASVGFAIGAFVAAYKMPFERLKKMAGVILVLGLVACLVLAIGGWATNGEGGGFIQCSLGACRWFNLGVSGFQPSELLKLGMLLYLAGIMGRCKKKGKLETTDMLVPFAVVMGLSLVFVAIIQKDLGTAVVMVGMALVMLLISGVKWWVLGGIGGVLLLLIVPMVVLFPHRMDRLASFGGEGNSYHLDNALIAIGTGGFWGVGVGNSVQATGYLPESINDSVFAIIGETFGFVGLILVVGCFAVLLNRLLKTSKGVRDTEGSLVAVGVFAWIGMHVIINMMGMTGIIPIKGITLPFLSYGGTGMIFAAAAVGIVLQLSRYTGREVRDEDSGSRRGVGRPRYANHRRSK